MLALYDNLLHDYCRSLSLFALSFLLFSSRLFSSLSHSLLYSTQNPIKIYSFPNQSARSAVLSAQWYGLSQRRTAVHQQHCRQSTPRGQAFPANQASGDSRVGSAHTHVDPACLITPWDRRETRTVRVIRSTLQHLLTCPGKRVREGAVVGMARVAYDYYPS